MISKTEHPLSRLAGWIKGKLSKKVIISFTTILFLIILLFIGIGATKSSKEMNSRKEAQAIQERVEAEIVDKHIQELINQGYENVTAEETFIMKMAEENHMEVRPNTTGKSLEEIIISHYDYFAIYYTVNIGDNAYLFKSKADADSFISTIKKYDNKNYEIKTAKKLVNQESKKEDLDKIISTKKKAYEKAKAEAEARERAKKEAQSKKSSSGSSASHSSGSKSSYQNYAHDLVINTYGWSEYDFECLVKLWNRESGWNPNAHNKSSGAHGIPQSLPASKMKSEGSDYYTNGYTQIRWGLKYIKGRYGSPSNAWAHSQKKGWY